MRPWYVIPVLAIASIAAAWLITHHVPLAIAIGACAAALTAAIRGVLGPSGVAAVAAAGGGAVGMLGALALHVTIRDAIGGAAAMFSIYELARDKQVTESPLPAAGAAVLAGVIDPSYAGLVCVAGIAWLRSPGSKPRGAIALPVIGAIAALVAISCALTSPHSSLYVHWLGRTPAHRDIANTLLRTGDVVGAMPAFAALVGLVSCILRDRVSGFAVGAIVGITAITSLAGGFVSPAAPLVAGLGTGVAIGRLAMLVRLPVGQQFVGATCGFVLVVAPAWTLIA
ncbi:MAG: hypothetical protein QM831_06815 [Kofleriaceae bacterium]